MQLDYYYTTEATCPETTSLNKNKWINVFNSMYACSIDVSCLTYSCMFVDSFYHVMNWNAKIGTTKCVAILNTGITSRLECMYLSNTSK